VMMFVMVREVIARVTVPMHPSGAWDQMMHMHE
jgi:hypothetical protein